VTPRSRFVCIALLLLAHALYGGVYQRTKDGKTLVWNNFPTPGDQAVWSGKRDANGYAVGAGTLTWYSASETFRTGSLLPAKGHAVVVVRLTGNMVRGKLNGSVLNEGADGKRRQLTFVNGINTGDRTAAPAVASNQRDDERLYAINSVEATPSPVPSEKSASVSDQSSKPILEKVSQAPAEGPSAPKVTYSPAAQVAIVTGISPRGSASSASSRSSAKPDDVEPAVKDRMISDFREETRAVLARVQGATDNFRGVDRLDGVQQLPPSVSESVGSLVDRARAFRAKVGYEAALSECRAETETVDALSAVDQITRNLASNDALEASAKVGEFLKNNPEPSAESEKALWSYLTSVRQLCASLENDATVHLHRAQSLAAASRPAEAIREYQEAYRLFPNPTTAEKIRQLQNNSLGL
jgi:hypothetical protein